MITLTGQREISGCNVYPDDVDPLAWYIMPQSPRIALDANGKPILSLVWYRRDVSKLSDEDRKTKLGGGILAVSVELSTTDEEMRNIRTTLAGDPDVLRSSGLEAGKLADALKIGTLPVKSGAVGIAILAESPGTDGKAAGDFVSTLVGAGKVSMTGKERASFMAKLTQDGAVLLWDMLEKNLPAINVHYDLDFDYRLVGVSMSVWCHADKAFHAIQDQWQHLQDDASFSDTTDGSNETLTFGQDTSHGARDAIFSCASSSEISGVSITQEADSDAVKPELIAQLTQQGNDMIKDYLASTFLDAKVGDDFKTDDEPKLSTALAKYGDTPYGHDSITQYNLKTWDESVHSNLSFNFKAKMVLEGHVAPNDNLGDALHGHSVDEFRTQVDIDAAFYKYLDVQVVCTADFDDDPVDLVTATLSYAGSGPQGDITKTQSFLFNKGAVPGRFATYLGSPDQVQYSYQYEVHYKGTSANYTGSGKSKDTILVLDVDMLGILRVDVVMGLVDWNNIQKAIVSLSYGTHSTELVMDSKTQTGRWTEVIASPVKQAYTYQVTYYDKSGQSIVVDAQTSTAKSLVLNQPLEQALQVTVVSAGSYGPGGLISQVVVALRYVDEKNDYTESTTIALTKEGDSKAWSIPLRDKTLVTYQYKVTVLYSDGVTREDDWKTTDDTVLAVGDPFGFRLSILPYLLKGGTWAFGTLNITFDDPQSGIHAEKTFEVRDFTSPLNWAFRLGAPDRHTYKYQLTLYKTDGSRVVVPAGQDSKEVLVLVPPQPA